MTHRDVQSTLWNGIGPRSESQWDRRRRRRSNVHGSPTARGGLCFCMTTGVSNTRALEFESALERDTSMNSSLCDEGWIRVNNRESKWGGHRLPRSCQHSSTRGCQRDAWGIWRRSCYEVKSAWYPMWNRRQLGAGAASDPAARRLEGKAGECRTLGSLARSIITWAIQCQWRGSQQYYMLVKMFSVQALETVKSSPEGVNAEVWRKQARNTNLALVSDMTWYFDLCWKDDLVNMMSGNWVVRSTRSERRGGHRVSSEVFLANNDLVKNLNKELCGPVRCF